MFLVNVPPALCVHYGARAVDRSYQVERLVVVADKDATFELGARRVPKDASRAKVRLHVDLRVMDPRLSTRDTTRAGQLPFREHPLKLAALEVRFDIAVDTHS